MTYIDVKWHHAIESEPVRLVSELNAERNETRKLEFFPDGRIGYAAEHISVYGTELSYVPVPSLEDINVQSKFRPPILVTVSSSNYGVYSGQNDAQQGTPADHPAASRPVGG